MYIDFNLKFFLVNAGIIETEKRRVLTSVPCSV